MLFIKKLEQCYSDILALPISWKIDFTERTSYTVKGDAKRSFVCEISLITSSAMRDSEDLKVMIQSIERLCFGWLNFRVVWTVIKDYPLLNCESLVALACSNCRVSLSTIYACPFCPGY